MPFDENGVKWSCEPCIRGHRSSKCAHYDRLMVSVGKAGRPLSKCPHVEGSCNCKKLGAFMVAIPKGSSCLCRPVYKMILGENGPTPAPLDLNAAPSASATSASSASPSPSKIQKSSKKHVKTVPEQVSRALHSIPEYHQHALQYGTSPVVNPYGSQAQAPCYPYNATGNFSQPDTFPISDDLSSGLGLSSDGFTTAASQSNMFQPSVQPKESMSTHTPGSCCSSSRTDSSNGIKAEPNIAVPNSYAVTSMAPSPVTEASSSTWHNFSNFDRHFSPVETTTNGVQPALSGFAPHVSPINPTSIGFEQVHPAQPDSAEASDLVSASLTTHGSTNHTSGIPHSCSCGPQCNCLACPDHPYNDVTVQHIQEVGRIIAQDSQAFGNEFDQQNPHANELQYSAAQMDQTLAELETNFENVPVESCCGTSNTPLDNGHDAQGIESFTADHLMVPDAYYTYEYQVGLPGACAGEAGNCQCGPSCSCLGCLTHGNL
ncbi:hypothetical protein BDW60DRAFT_87914 [Aspergillus nidulans var. acristatus]